MQRGSLSLHMWINSARMTSRKERTIQNNKKNVIFAQEVCSVGKEEQEVKQDLFLSRKPRLSNRKASFQKKHRKHLSQDVQIEGKKTLTTVGVCKKIAARTKPWKLWTTSKNGPQKSTMTMQQRQAHFGNQWFFVQTAAGGSNTRPTRQRPEIRQT